MKKRIYTLVSLITVFSLTLVSFAQAGTLTTVTVTPINPYGGGVGTYTVSFIVASSTEIEAQIRLIFPAGFNIAASTGTSTITASSTGASEVATSTVSGQELTLWLADGSVTPASETIQISGIANIQSPYAGGSFTLGVQTLTLANGASDSASSTAYAVIAASVTKKAGDAAPPSSSIAMPTDGLSIIAGQAYLISGDGSDVGGSTVNTVEISLDGGQTWLLAPSNATGGTFYWSYNWQNPTEGTHTIKVRATDSKGNIESPSAGVDITVTGSAASPAATPTPAPETPAEAGTIAALQTQVATLQQTLLGLLQQFIQLLQAQL